MSEKISAAFPFTSQFIEIDGSKIHYIEEGQGDPMLFLHGMPTSNYLWRNIIPRLSEVAHCIAPDLIGMGKSSKPDISYTIFEHIHYIEQFINLKQLTRITMVLHGWGSVIGFYLAHKYPERIKALAFYESYLGPAASSEMLSLLVQQLAVNLKNSKASYKAIVEDNFLINQLLPAAVIRELSAEELAHYAAPFQTKASRKVLWQYVQDLPKENGPIEVVNLIRDYSEWLMTCSQPKLFMYGVPGFMTPIATVVWARQHLPHLTTVDLGEVLHFAQETEPRIFADTLYKWYKALL